MDNKQPMIEARHISKEYRLGVIGGTTLREDLQRLGAKLRGKEDPTRIIGQSAVAPGHFLALDDLSFTVGRGEAVGIIGHNGAGKSTLLKLITRVTAPTAGTLGLNGRVASMLEVGTGFHPELTGRENIYMNGAILGMSRKEIDAKLEEIIEFSEVRDFIDTPVKRYSSGMYVKLAFAVAAHLDSEIVIMDEVLAVGDMAFQKKCLRKMREAATMEGRTVLYVSHNMNTIRQLCDRCIVLNHGKIVFDGGVEEGIAVYMNQNDDMLPTYDYADLVRSSDYNRQVEFRSVTLSAPADNRIPRGDDLPFTFTLAAKRRCDALFLRLELFYLDDTVAGTVFSDKPIALDESGETAVSLSFNTTHLAPGKYKAVALAFERDRYGNEASLDRVEPAFLFEVTQQSENELLWLHSYWGHVRFDDMKVTEVKKA